MLHLKTSTRAVRTARARLLSGLVTAGILTGMLGVPAYAVDSARTAQSGSLGYTTEERDGGKDRRRTPTSRDSARRTVFQVPRHFTSTPQLFDSERPSGLSLSPSLLTGGNDALTSGQQAQQSGNQFDPAEDLAWSTDCDADPDTAKDFCQEPTGYYRVHGTITHGRNEIVPDPGNEPHSKAPQYEYIDVDYVGVVGAREVLVRVADGCGLHADTYTNVAGEYSVAFPSWCGDKDAKVTVYSISSPGPGKQVALGVHTGPEVPNELEDFEDDPTDYTVVSGLVGTFNPEADAEVPESCADNSCNGGVLIGKNFATWMEGSLFEQGKFSRDGEVSRALTIMENTMTALDYYRQLVSPSRLPQINLALSDAALDGSDDTAFYRHNESQLIYIPPRMEWSEWAVVHESGHYFDGGVLVQGGLGNYGRWGEPMANVRAGLILGTSWMAAAEDLAAENLDVQGNWDEQAGAVQPPDDVPVSGPGQGWTWRILWDLSDGVGNEPIDFGYGDFDQWDGGGESASPLNHLINGVVMEYLPQRDGSVHPDYVDRGQSGPDLVDMLDGFACLYGMDQLHMETLLHEVMDYDYDFAHCNDIDNEAPAP